MLPASISGFTYPALSVFPTSVSNCSPQSTILTASGAQSYSWSPGSGVNNYFVVNPSTTTTYTVNSILSNGCPASASIKVNIGSIAPIPVIKTQTYKLCPGTTSILLTLKEDTFYSGMNYQWQTIDCNNIAHDISGANSNQYSVTSSNQYRLKMGCSGNFSYSNIIPIIQVTNCNFSSQVCSGQGGGPGGGIGGGKLNLSISEELPTETLELYPNPNNGEFNLLVTNTILAESVISVINILGEEVYSAKQILMKGENKFQIDLTNYPKGIYLVRIQKENTQLQVKMIYH